MDNFILQDWIVLVVTAIIVFVVVFALRWLLLFKPASLSAEERLPRQLAMLGITIVSIIVIVLALPVSESSRNQLLGLFGVLLSGVIAFSSTTIVSNLMAGLVLRFNKPFKAGDFIICNGFEGRVTEKEVIRSSGTLISAEASIGYDVHHATVERHLKDAALKVGLSDVFVHIIELGSFSVNYKVSGMLEDTKSMLTTQSALFASILDELHANDIEIMSPNIMAQRAVDPAYSFIAKAKVVTVADTVNQEDIVFDKADEAEKNETQRLEIQTEIALLKESLTNKNKDVTGAKALSDEQKEAVLNKVEILEANLAKLTSNAS
jgi:small conductance mechanosensitive channel